MRQELSTYIAALLYEYDRLVVPSLGSFELSHAPALVDQVQGQVSAPSKQIRFNENLVLDDGLLASYVQTQRATSAAATQAWLTQELADIKAALDRREIVELPGVGRFFRNYEMQLQFVADNVNFNTDAYGLKTVALQPIHRSVAERTQPTPVVPPARVTPPDFLKQVSAWGQRYLSWFIGLAVVLFAIIIYLAVFPPAETPDEVIVDVPKERLNTSPSKDVQTDETPTENATAESHTNDDARPAESQNSEVAEPAPPTKPLDTEAPTPLPNEHTAVIAVGLYSKSDNARRMVADISKAGFSPFTVKEKNSTRVGVQVSYQTEAELDAALREVRKLFTESAFVLLKDGKKANE